LSNFSQLQQALTFANSGQLNQALSILKKLKKHQDVRIQASQLIIKILITLKNFVQAKTELSQLMFFLPNDYGILNTYTTICLQTNDIANICSQHINFITNNPSHALACFNCAYYLKIIGKFEKSLNFYEKALLLNITAPHEVYLNMATICSDHLRDESKAEIYLKQAIALKFDYAPAFYNLANLYEQQGDRDSAYSYFVKSYEADPLYSNVLARLADINRIISGDDVLIALMQAQLADNLLNNEQRCNLHYGLGKSFDDCKMYTQAFEHYNKANYIDQQTLPIYDPEVISDKIDTIISSYESNNDLVLDTCDKNDPIFICGMFRSGSTLLEQILAAHNEVTAGGEIDFFQRFINNQQMPFPRIVETLSKVEYAEIARDYQRAIQKAFPNAKFITDKRPDNLLYLGLIKKIFPRAKIIFTERNVLDNCLSVYFLRLGATMNYATDLKNCIHYYQQQQRLIAYWQSKFGNDIFTFNYDRYVHSPELSTRELLTFLGLAWDENCLAFNQVKNSVKTASVWQVREPLYQTSSGRWKNYQQQLAMLNLPIKLV